VGDVLEALVEVGGSLDVWPGVVHGYPTPSPGVWKSWVKCEGPAWEPGLPFGFVLFI
jgi:hypothetical protein